MFDDLMDHCTTLCTGSSFGYKQRKAAKDYVVTARDVEKFDRQIKRAAKDNSLYERIANHSVDSRSKPIATGRQVNNALPANRVRSNPRQLTAHYSRILLDGSKNNRRIPEFDGTEGIHAGIKSQITASKLATKSVSSWGR